jgi:hypothetical protein
MTQDPEYSKGYAAGIRKNAKAFTELKNTIAQLRNERKERAYFASLDVVTRNCTQWSIGGEKVKDAEGYCTLAKIFTEHSIKILDTMK